MLGRDGLRLHTELYPCQVSPHLELLLGAKLLVDHAGSLIKQRRRKPTTATTSVPRFCFSSLLF